MTGILLAALTLPGPGLKSSGPATVPLHPGTLVVELGGPAFGVSWTGSISVDQNGVPRVSGEPGLRWEDWLATRSDTGFLATARRAARFVRALLEVPAHLEWQSIPGLGGQAR